MRIPDVNVLLSAALAELPQHNAARRWLRTAINEPEPLGVSDIVLTGFVRIATSRLFQAPLSHDLAFDFCDQIRQSRCYRALTTEAQQWASFRKLATAHARTGGDFTDAYIAAFALVRGATVVTFDRGFRRFDGLRLHEPV
jgi:toxin-antitoxin system PIN domain toxin